MIRTRDEGKTWETVWEGDGRLTVMAQGEAGELFLAGWTTKTPTMTPLLLHTLDDGKHWDELQVPGRFSGLVRAPDGSLLGVGFGPQIQLSADGGRSWQPRPITHRGYMNAITARKNGDLIAVGFNGAVLESTDRGKTWAAQELGIPWTQTLYGVWASPEGDVYVVGDSGIILHRTGG